MKILIVDDDPTALLVASMALSHVGGFDVLQATCGRDAVQYAREQMPDAILMDIVMQDIDGPDVVKLLQTQPETSRIPVILHTARSDPAEIRILVSLGVKGVIEKPFDPMALPGEVKRILGP